MTTENNPEAKARAAVRRAEHTDEREAALDRLCTLMRAQGAVGAWEQHKHVRFVLTSHCLGCQSKQQAEAEYAAACAAVEAG